MSDLFKIRWSLSASNDLDGILEYIATQDGVDSSIHIYEKLIARIESLSKLPRRCRIVPELKGIGVTEFRELIVSPYRICFRIHSSKIVLLSVLDGRRDLEQILIDRALSLDV